MKKILSGILGIFAVFSFAVVAHAATTVVVTGDTSAGENQPGWLFNRDASTSTPFEFNEDQASIGDGSLYVQPIGTNASDKFIAENFLATPVSVINSISFDYLIAGNGDTNDSDQFYLNVYANIDNTNKYYDCRYDYVASGGSTSGFTPLSVNTTDTPTRVVKSGSGRLASCPATLEQMPTGSYVRAFAINVGDTSANDQGLGGYLDNVVVDTDTDVTTYDFEATNPAPSQVTGMTVFKGATEVGCGAVINQRNIKVDWDDVSDSDFDFYQYQADTDMAAPYEFTTNVTNSERSGTIRDQDGTYNYRVRAVDTAGNEGEWSDWCSATLDRLAPDVEVTNPAEGATVSGTVEVKGTVSDDNLLRYYAVVYDSENNVVAGPRTVNEDEEFTDQLLFTWDTTQVEDGQYRIHLAARDQAGNRDSGSEDNVLVTVNNTPDNKDQCKNGGWRTFTNPTFRNQGQCVSYFTSQSKNKVTVNQSNNTTVSNNVTVTQNTGGNKANRNTGNSTVTTGNNSSIIEVITRAARNIFIFR